MVDLYVDRDLRRRWEAEHSPTNIYYAGLLPLCTFGVEIVGMPPSTLALCVEGGVVCLQVHHKDAEELLSVR